MTVIECFSGSHVDNMAACLRLRPEKVIFVGNGGEMDAPVKRYRELLRQRKQATKLETKDVGSKDIGEICAVLVGLIRQEADCVIDITGGDEPVILAVGAVLASMERKDFQRIRVEKFDHSTGVVRDCLCDNKPVAGKAVGLTVEELITIHGGKLHPETMKFSADFTLDRLEGLWQLASKEPKEWNQAIMLLNELESRADSKKQVYLPLSHLRGSISDFERKEEKVRALLEQLHGCGAIINESSRNSLEYTYTSCLARYCTLKAGNVLEVKTLLEGQAVLEGGAPLFQHCQIGVSIDWDGVIHEPKEQIPDTRNEIDVVLMHGATPLFVSCKNGGIGEEELYKLNAVARRFGGPYARKMLIATDLDRGSAAANRSFAQRAWDMDIFLVADAADLSSKEWKEIFQEALQ